MAEKKTAKEEAVQEQVQSGPRMVKIKLFKDNYKYKDDVFVRVAGRTWQIQRGVEVTVPDYVALVIEQSIAQDNATADLISRLSDEARAANL